MSEKLVLIDGNSIMNRAFFGMPPLTNAEGFPTNAIYGFLNILFKIIDEENPGYLVVAFDVKAPTFRHKIYDAYKGTRKPMPEELRQQWPVLKELLMAMNIRIVEKAGYEADDILGTIAKRGEAKGMEVSLVSGDRDLLQISSAHIKIRIPKTKGGKTEVYDYYPDDVKNEYGITPLQIIELKALMGDSSDNIPGVPKIGEKTATALITEYGCIENLKDHIDEIAKKSIKDTLTDNFDMAVLSKTLATIDTDADIEFEFTEAEMEPMYTKNAYDIMKNLGFKNFFSRFSVEEENKAEFKMIDALSDAEEFFNKLNSCSSSVVGIDIQSDDDIIGASFCMDKASAIYIGAGTDISSNYIAQKIIEFISKSDKAIVSMFDVKKIYHVLPMLADFRLAENVLFDTLIASYLLNPLKNDYEIADVAAEHGISMKNYAESFGKKKIIEAALDKEAFMNYSCMSAVVNYMSCNSLIEKLKEENMYNLFKSVEMPLTVSLYSMEHYGIRIIPQELIQYGDKLAVEINELEKAIHEEAGESFNINSPKQLGEILFEKMGIPGGKKTKTGYSTAADVLEKLSEEYPFVGKILEYRGLAKLKSTYADGLINYIDGNNRIHSTFNQTITATGRISSNEPNLQNIPIRMEQGRLIRKVFVPEEGYEFIDADYSQIELRVVAHMSGDEKLIEAFNQEEDIHRTTASKVFHVPFDEVTPLQRRNAKAVNFGIIYGISSFGLSQDLNISRKDAKEFIEKYFETFPSVKSFLDKLVEDAKENGYVTSLFDRRRPMPELKSSNFMQRSFGERVAMNAPVQGTAADIIKIAMIKVMKRMADEGLKSRLILQVHDELLIEAAKEEADKVRIILKEEMENAVKLSVKLIVDMHSGNTWYDTK